MRRRARFLRKARELAYRDLGGLVFNLHRFGQRNDALVLAKLTPLGQIDAELRALEAALRERRPVTVLREAGITACPRCAAIHGSEDRFCPNCGLAMGRHADLPIGGAPAAGAPAPRRAASAARRARPQPRPPPAPDRSPSRPAPRDRAGAAPHAAPAPTAGPPTRVDRRSRPAPPPAPDARDAGCAAPSPPCSTPPRRSRERPRTAPRADPAPARGADTAPPAGERHGDPRPLAGPVSGASPPTLVAGTHRTRAGADRARRRSVPAVRRAAAPRAGLVPALRGRRPDAPGGDAQLEGAP